jgi:hypothetical protein
MERMYSGAYGGQAQVQWLWAPAGNPPAWATLGAFQPSADHKYGRLIVEGITTGNNQIGTSSDNHFRWFTYFGNGDQSYFDQGGNAYHHATCYFGGGNQSYADSNGDLTMSGSSLITRNNCTYHRGNWVAAFFGTGDQTYFDTAGNLYNGGGLVYYGANWQFHTTCYFGNGNQVYFDTNGNFSGNCTHYNGTEYFQKTVYFGTGNQGYMDTSSNCSMNQMNFPPAGDGAWHFDKWVGNGSYWQTFVNGGIVLSMSANWCDERHKSDIHPVEVDALQALRQVELVSFILENKELAKRSGERGRKLDSHPRHFDIGFTAQRTRPFIPDAIHESEGPDGERESMLDTLPIVAYLVRAVQQMADRIEVLEHGRH